MNTAGHWQQLWEQKAPDQVGWYEQDPKQSLTMIEAADLHADAAILDVGGGMSRLAGKLLEAGYTDITVADLSEAALDQARAGLGERAQEIDWVVADARKHAFGRDFDLWHDRAVFHFMVEAPDCDGYLDVLMRTLRPGGHLIVGTFGPDGPTQCSGLPVRRYGIEELSAQLGPEFELIGSEIQVHQTPSGREQQFLWAHFRRS